MNLVRAIVRAYDSATMTATVELTGSMASTISGVKVLWASANATDMATGNTVLAAILDDGTIYVLGAI